MWHNIIDWSWRMIMLSMCKWMEFRVHSFACLLQIFKRLSVSTPSSFHVVYLLLNIGMNLLTLDFCVFFIMEVFIKTNLRLWWMIPHQVRSLNACNEFLIECNLHKDLNFKPMGDVTQKHVSFFFCIVNVLYSV